jgi:alkanesulfonate monooxygenase SsuD/methylene tetrahydromethanopterin reductase-like flavin-dependent oxidoreductase (luciferase family)
MTSILIAPVRNAGVLATQAATIDSLSNGRLTLGLAVGGREDDFVAGQAPFRNRGKRFDEMLTHMRRVWAGETFMDESHPSGPVPVQPGGLEILLGGSSPAAIARVGRSATSNVLARSMKPSSHRGPSMVAPANRDSFQASATPSVTNPSSNKRAPTSTTTTHGLARKSQPVVPKASSPPPKRCSKPWQGSSP